MPLADLQGMNAGRELDALVAETVMGWRALQDSHCAECEAMIAEGTLMMSDPQGLVGVVPDYSTSIAAAWEVFEWLCKRGDDVAEVVQLTWNIQTGWWCTSERWVTVDVQGNADTAPLAICLAALKACEAEAPA